MLKSTLSNDAIFLDLNLIRNIDTREKLYPKKRISYTYIPKPILSPNPISVNHRPATPNRAMLNDTSKLP